MQIIDTHSHLFVEEFASDLPEVIARSREAGIERIYMPNIDITTVADMLAVSQAYEGYCFPMLGLHPTSVDGGYRAALGALKPLLDEPGNPFVAIGEVGLDLYWDRTYHREQEDAFRTQIEWALEHQLPLVIHCREAFREMVDLMKPYKSAPLKGIFHSFTGTADEAAELLGFEGFMLGINGVLTFKKSSLPTALNSVPLERVVLETDSPYLAPVPHRGKRNESSYIRFTLAHFASVYGMDMEAVAEITSKNAQKVFDRG